MIILPGRRLAIHLMAQPDIASALISDPLLTGQGILSRFLATAPDTASGTRMWREPLPESDVSMKRYGARLLEILERPLPLAPDTQNTLTPRVVPLKPNAASLWKRFHDHIEHRVAPGGELEPVRGLANKLPEHAARLAAVLSLVHDIDAGEVSSEALAAGIELAQHYAAEALRLFGASQVSGKLQDAQRLLQWLHSQPGPLISLPDIYQRGPNCIRDQATASELVRLLEEHGHLIRLPNGATVAGQYRRDVWRIVRG